MPKPSYGTACPNCGAPKVVSRREAEDAFENAPEAPSHSWVCTCGEFVSALVDEKTKAPPAPKPRKPLERSGGLERKGKGLKRGGRLKRSRKPSKTSLEKALAAIWGEGARKLPCASCGRNTDYSRGVVVEGHHITRERLILDRGKALGWDAEGKARRLYDVRNRLPLCGDCHRRHHSKMGKLAWKLVKRFAPGAEAFAKEVGLLLEARRDYR